MWSQHASQDGDQDGSGDGGGHLGGRGAAQRDGVAPVRTAAGDRGVVGDAQQSWRRGSVAGNIVYTATLVAEASKACDGRETCGEDVRFCINFASPTGNHELNISLSNKKVSYLLFQCSRPFRWRHMSH